MTTEPENVILVLLRRLDAKVDRIIDDLRDIKTRMTAVEEAVSNIRQGLPCQMSEVRQ